MTPDKKQKMSRNWQTHRRDASKTDEIMAKRPMLNAEGTKCIGICSYN